MGILGGGGGGVKPKENKGAPTLYEWNQMDQSKQLASEQGKGKSLGGVLYDIVGKVLAIVHL